MDDGPNRGQPTDRVDVEWELWSDEVILAAAAVLDPAAASDGPAVDALRAAGAVVALSAGSDGEPTVGGAVEETAVGPVLIGLPADIEAVRRSDQDRALRWRLELRDVLGSLLVDDGWRVTGFAKSGWYVLDRKGHS
jgi:predicted GNAT superfamily acetyltransferase